MHEPAVGFWCWCFVLGEVDPARGFDGVADAAGGGGCEERICCESLRMGGGILFVGHFFRVGELVERELVLVDFQSFVEGWAR